MASYSRLDATPTRTRHAKPKQQLVVELRTKPALYAPGSGPLPLPVTLAPPNDSTAFIVDRILLASPGLAQDGKPLPRRMTYIVGWYDLPAARVLVPAMNILDYVSPWVLEEWEYQFELELEEEREKLIEDKEKEKRERQLAASHPQKSAGKKRKRGRPPTHKHTQIEAGAVALPETEEEASRARVKSGTMSLSTPQKTRLTDFAGLSDDDRSPSRGTTRAGDKGGGGGSTAQENDEIAGTPHGATTQKQRAWDAFNTTMQSKPPKVTPVPLPPIPKPFSTSQQRTLPTMFTCRSTLGGVSSADSSATSKSTTPVPLPPLPPLRPSKSVLAPDPWLQAAGNTHRGDMRPASASSAPPPTASAFESHNGSSSSSRRRERPSSSTSANQPRKRRKKRRDQEVPLLDESGLPLWIVKRIEDEALFEVEGQGLQRLYKVRWEGDWPPEENPTWEPAENLPEKMIRNWQKTGPKDRKRLAKGLSRHHGTRKSLLSSNGKTTIGQTKQTKLSWGPKEGTKFTSVSEAFQGCVGKDDLEMDHENEHQSRGSENQHERNDLLVVDSEMDRGKTGSKAASEALPRPSFAERMSSSWGAFFGGR